MERASHNGWSRTAAAALLTCLLSLGAAGNAAASGPDRAFKTPIAHGAAGAHTAVSSGSLAAGLRRIFKGPGGAYVRDAGTDQVLFQRSAGRARILASNSKLFTTSAALGRFGPDGRLLTAVWSGDDVSDGVSQSLFLRGGGDPTLSDSGLGKLAARVRAAGVVSVQGPLYYDDFFLDQKGSPQHGVRRESVGTLSALTLGGRPARTTAQRFDKALRKAGVSISNKIERREVPPATAAPPASPLPPPVVAGPVRIADLESPPIADIARSTNVPSNNYLAEMLLKDLGGTFGGSGTTRSGVAVAKAFAAGRGAKLKAENGSGLSRRNKSSPASVGSLLDSLIEVDAGASPEKQQEQQRLRDAFVGSLAIAGRNGTLAHRMRGTAAAGSCHAKTGTLSGISALSGYCFRGAADEDHAVVFSILMSGDVNRAHLVQDRMAALIARYSG